MLYSVPADHSDIRPVPTPEHQASGCFALLDDSDASSADPRSRLYTGFAGALEYSSVTGLPSLFERMQQSQKRGLHAIGLFTYELGADLPADVQQESAGPLAQILLFERCDMLSREQVDVWLTMRTGHAGTQLPAGIAGLHANVSEHDFTAAIARIHAWIEAGDTYQVNFTYRLRFSAFGDHVELYRKLRARQPVPYGALLELPDGGAVLSLSPELFVRHRDSLLTARPMKGTAPASGNAEADAAIAAALAADAKNRAENLMIVDLLRNDLGRIAETGSVRVPALFEVDRYGVVLQMTSTVEAQLRPDAALADIFCAIFPCGSVTGAPKHRTMQIIRELEPDKRGIYTGAIGWFDAPPADRAVGDFCLSVPIRTLRLLPPAPDGTRSGEMGVGAGIVHDSDAAREYAECRLKARFLSGLPQDFTLFETMHATREDGCRHVELHLARLRSSAAYFGMPYDQSGIRARLAETCAVLPAGSAHRVRLTLGCSGFDVSSAPLSVLAAPVRLLLSPLPVLGDDLFLRHKTSVRVRYDEAMRAAESRGAFDMLFFNLRGELTEGARSNVFVKLAGRWHTPPLAAGALPGVMRSVLMTDPAWNAVERTISVEDLRAAEEVVVTNALRGAVRATIDWQADEMS